MLLLAASLGAELPVLLGSLDCDRNHLEELIRREGTAMAG